MDKNFNNSLLLLQINDPFFPMGAYTHSYGLETYVQKGIVKDQKSAMQYLSSNIRTSLLFGDMLALKLAYGLSYEANISELVKLDETYYALKAPKEVRIAGEKFTSRFIKNVKALPLSYKTDCFNIYCTMLEQETCKGQLAVVYGAFCASIGISLESSVLHFTYAQASGIVNNLVKLIPLSQTDGQIILNKSFSYISESIKQLQALTFNDLGSSTPAFELRSMQHEMLYSRLYMS